ncbi:CRISPR-associated endoribonuclease Cas2 [Planctomycetes bacterium Pan216]|uniref:CRISPR-associated endoribonuclease Cas2 n=1 Tax=Kolteria novifilia TaxID=2527975 RepID=A0A518B0G4_9BACT|nr:CRISPR-associated endoribonuclease Cas2 [Planctomycetes bacterium Pan216]
MIEPRAGTFLGRMSARVRDELWAKAIDGAKGGTCVQIWRANTEQGFAYRVFGEPQRRLVDIEGLHLVARTISQN